MPCNVISTREAHNQHKLGYPHFHSTSLLLLDIVRCGLDLLCLPKKLSVPAKKEFVFNVQKKWHDHLRLEWD